MDRFAEARPRRLDTTTCLGGGATILCHTVAVQLAAAPRGGALSCCIQKVCRYGTVYSLRLACRLILLVCGFYWIEHQPPTDPQHQPVSCGPHRNVEEKEEETERSQECHRRNGNNSCSNSISSRNNDDNTNRNTTNFLCGTISVIFRE